MTRSRDAAARRGLPASLLSRRPQVSALLAWFRSPRKMAPVGVFSAAVLLVCANILVSRFYQRWDVTEARLYTLSRSTLDTLHGLDEPVEVVVFLADGDPLLASVRHMLEAYAAESRQLTARYVDPDRNPAEYLALQQEFEIVEGTTQDGRVISAAALVIVRGRERWFVTPDDLTSLEPGESQVRSRLEQALTEGIRQVLGRERVSVCFTLGHGEASPDAGGPTGLAEFRFRLSKNNYDVRRVDLASPRASESLTGCQLVVVAGPERPFSADAVARLEGHVQAGGNLLLALGLLLDDAGKVRASGLESLAELVGVKLGSDVVVETAEAFVLPAGKYGEVYRATPKAHAVTQGLVERGAEPAYVVVQLPQSLEPMPGRDSVSVLLTSSDKAERIRQLGDWVAGDAPAVAGEGPFALAIAATLAPSGADGAGAKPARVAIVGATNLFWARSWRDPALSANRAFVESMVSWLAAQPQLVSIPEKPGRPAGLALTEASLSELFNYVLFYMPGTALALALLVFYRRRSEPGHKSS